VIVGWGGSYLIGQTGSIQTLVTTDIVALAVGVSVGIGLFFGFYPAWQGSRLDPIQALRAE
jgi:putative ABC transport system permease protein